MTRMIEGTASLTKKQQEQIAAIKQVMKNAPYLTNQTEIGKRAAEFMEDGKPIDQSRISKLSKLFSYKMSDFEKNLENI